MRNIPKKYLIVIGVFVVVVLVSLFIIFNPFNHLDSATLAARRGATELLSVTIMTDLVSYYNVESNFLDFSKSLAVKQKIAGEILDLKTKYGGDYDYKIFEISERGLSIKTVEKTTGTYYCIDNATYVPVEIKSDQFTVNSDCTGKRL